MDDFIDDHILEELNKKIKQCPELENDISRLFEFAFIEMFIAPIYAMSPQELDKALSDLWQQGFKTGEDEDDGVFGWNSK